MPSALSTTDISNMALDYLDEAPLTSFDSDTGSVARLMRRLFWPTAWELARASPWNCMLARASLPALSTAPPFGWTYAYEMPADCLRVLPITVDGTENGTPTSFKVEGLNILTDQAAPLNIRYIQRISNTGLFDNSFCSVLAIALAQKASHQITGKQSYAQLLSQMYTNALMQAQIIDSLEGTPDSIIDDDWVNARQ